MEQVVSELRRQLTLATEALRQAQRRATAGQLALEIIDEVEALGNLAFLARNCAESPEELERYLRISEDKSANVNQIVARTLNSVRLSRQPQKSDLAAITEAALRVHQRVIDAKKIQLVKQLRGDFTAEVHATEVMHAISNLLVNALDALPEYGVLTLRLRKTQGHIHLLIADNGHGIPEEHRDKIFKPFFTTKEDRGNGLGLAFSKEIVERHRGKLWMRSSVGPANSGTTFRISLPE